MMRTGVILILVAVAGSIALAAVLQAGVMAQVVALRRGEPTGFRTFWRGFRRHWAPLLLPALFWAALGLWGVLVLWLMQMALALLGELAWLAFSRSHCSPGQSS